MKKLMFAAALALGASCFAAGESIESNIVGYQTYELTDGYNLFCPMFESTGGKLDVQSMKLVGQGVQGDGFTEQIQIINEDGSVGGIYVWTKAEWIKEANPDLKNVVDAWTDGATLAPISIPLTRGKGFYICSDLYSSIADSVSVQVSGGMSLEDFSITLIGGNNYEIVGNASPKNLDIQDLKLSEEALGDGFSEQLQILNEDGSVGTTYVWTKAEWIREAHPNLENVVDSWTDGATLAPITMPVNAGQGLFIVTAVKGTKFIVPTPVK